MDSNLNILEGKVLEAVELIKELREENGRLSGRNEELETRCTELEETNTRLNHELDELRREAANVEVYEEKRKEIENRVGDLLHKLEALA